MWTPRRILLLLTTLFGFGAVYVGYSRFLGRIDGLPNLPSKYLDTDDRPLPEPPPVVSPTVQKLREAFGENCAELGAAYPTRLEIRESGLVFAAGMPQIGTEPTKFVRLAPLSVAIFGKPKAAHEKVPGEVTEISTLHSDEGILEFDRPIASDRDMLTGKAKLVGIELRSNPDPHSTDPRNGRIVLGNNQQSSDPARFLVMKTPGPVFYRTADHPESANPSQPQIWTTAAVEIVNRDNLPRSVRGNALPAVAVASDDTLLSGIVADMALALHTAPPTVTASGMKIFMNRSEPGAAKSKRGTGFSGIRELIFNENVLFSLWVDGSGGFPGGDSKPGTPAKAPEPGLGLAALAGGLHDGLAASNRLKSKALLRIRTLGPFRYDIAKNTAVFELAPQANPLVPNNVEVLRFLPLGGKDYLVCQKLEIEFHGNIAGRPDAPRSRESGPGFKRLHASGGHVLISAATEQLQAQGTSLIYQSDAVLRRNTTILRGAPLSAVRGRNVLLAGTPAEPAELAMSSADPTPGQESATDITIKGTGRIDIYDEATNKPSISATWKQSLTQAREVIGGKPLDRLTFTGDGEFVDANGQFRLKSDVLKLWLQAGSQSAAGSKPMPHMLQGLGHVSGMSDDAIIDQSDHLTVMFVEGQPAATKPATIAASAPGAAAPTAKTVSRTSTEPAKANPIHLSARKIDLWLHRFAGDVKTDSPKYDLHEARCDDRVVVLQAPADPKKSLTGLDIRGGGLLLKKRGTGHAMTVTGTPVEVARVRFDNVTISGPSVEIDQPANTVAVKGGGWLRMPSSGNLAGAAVNEKAEITIHWQSEMRFLGDRRWATFVGQVQAVQGLAEGAVSTSPMVTRTSVACHQLDVTFDRPVDFNRMNRPDKKPEGDPKVETVVCTPAPEDEAAGANRFVLYLEESVDRVSKKMVKAQQIEAKTLEVRVKEQGGKDDGSHVTATGPGVTRLLQPGEKENVGPRVANAKPESEMKLTIVRFNGRLEMVDQKGVFQKAVFRDSVRVAHVPTENLTLLVDEFATPPPRSMFLKCNDTFTVSSYRGKSGETRSMEAVDGAEMKTDDYIGLGHTITYDGTLVTLRGYRDGPATLYRRQRPLTDRDYKSGNPLIYNTKTGQVSGAESSGGQFTTPK